MGSRDGAVDHGSWPTGMVGEGSTWTDEGERPIVVKGEVSVIWSETIR